MLYIAHIWASLVSQTVKKLQYRGPGFDPWVGNIPWMRKWLPTPVLLPGDSHGQRSLVGYSPWSCQKSDMTEWLSTHTTHNLTSLLNNWRLIPLNDPPYFAYHLMPLPSATQVLFSTLCSTADFLVIERWQSTEHTKAVTSS